MLSGKKNQKKISNIKDCPHSFYFMKVECFKINPFHFYARVLLKKNIFKMKVNTLVTKYTDSVTFNFYSCSQSDVVNYAILSPQSYTFFVFDLICE